MEEAKTTTLIKVECTDQVLRLTQTPTIASGGVKEDTVEFAFDNLWDGFNLAAVFYRSEKEVYHVEIVDNRCIVPREVLANPGYFYLGVMGVKDGVTRTTNVLSYRVEAGAITEGVKPPEPTPSIYEQILASVKYAEQIAQSVRNDADAGKFNGAKGEKGDTGAQGVQGVQGIQGVKGEPGKDGVDGTDANVTAQNIEAALGYAPVKDVQVAGTSVMTDGVANVPIANKGGLGVSSVDDYSIGTTDAGVLFLYNSRNGDIDARSANIAVTPYNLDYAVKAAMCDGKGAAWTDAEQKAARERMGVDKSYELIEEIVINESVAQVVRTNMSLAEMRIVVEVPISDSAGAVAIEVYSKSTLIGYGYIGNLINKEHIRMAKFSVKRDRGTYVFSTVSTNGDLAVQKAGVSALNETASLFPVENAITKISLYSTSSSISLPIGTKITIEGEPI
nr:MAG TPA: nucleoid-associated protein [Caudoviricetes sp.]